MAERHSKGGEEETTFGSTTSGYWIGKQLHVEQLIVCHFEPTRCGLFEIGTKGCLMFSTSSGVKPPCPNSY